jgi:uncharacterized protein Yka (UPF0111/DUF47 family)
MVPRLGWLLPENPDVLGMLCVQAEITVEGMKALVDWASGDADAGSRLRQAEHTADDAVRTLRLALQETFITPVGHEDIYVLSERLDAVLTRAKDAVREAEVMAMPPDAAVAEMAGQLAEGVGYIATAFQRLDHRQEGPATDAADQAHRVSRHVEKTYRDAMSRLLSVTDLRELMGRRELYRRFARIAETLDEVADRIWYSTVKEL